MNVQVTNAALTRQQQVMQMLHELGLPAHRLGYKELSVAIPRYAGEDTQSLTKELYPYLAKRFHASDWHAVESAMRNAIVTAWKTRDPLVWEQYFPHLRRVPSNKQFIATLAEHLEYSSTSRDWCAIPADGSVKPSLIQEFPCTRMNTAQDGPLFQENG